MALYLLIKLRLITLSCALCCCSSQGKTVANYEPVYSDEQASFLHEYRFDVSKLEPVVAKPHFPDNRALARECKDVKIDSSCTGGKTEDFLAAAKVFLASVDKVKVPTFLVPATHKVWMDVYNLLVPGSGCKTCYQIFEEAGCDTPTNPNCGACLGGPQDTYARMNKPQVCVSTTNRNFPGRMGHKEGQIYLASSSTAAASALTGFVIDPRDFFVVTTAKDAAGMLDALRAIDETNNASAK